MDTKYLWGGLLVAVVIAIGGYFYPQAGTRFGSILDTSYFDFFQATTAGGFQIGSNTVLSAAGFQPSTTSTLISRINTGTCFIQAYATTIAASTTASVDCQGTAAVGGITGVLDTALTGIKLGDNVVVTLSTTTAGTTSNGIAVIGAAASTTAGFITLTVSNLTGATFTWPTSGVATGTASYIATH